MLIMLTKAWNKLVKVIKEHCRSPEEQFLAQATDAADLERRIRLIESRDRLERVGAFTNTILK